MFGHRKLIKGEAAFFIHPGEYIEGGIQKVEVLEESECLMMKSLSNFKDEQGNQRKAGEQWLISGPTSIPPMIDTSIIDRRQTFALAENDGIYVRNLDTGEVSLITGPRKYMLD